MLRSGIERRGIGSFSLFNLDTTRIIDIKKRVEK
jgi:hypothetical protein